MLLSAPDGTCCDMERAAAPAGSGAPEPLALAGAVCARVCHDLAGTLGAMAGMLDLVAESQDAEALALASSCARELTARLRLLRAAWGADTDGASSLCWPAACRGRTG